MWIWMAAALAGRADALQKLIDDDRIVEAQKRCDRWGAWVSETEPAVREACAEAMWSRAAKDDTFAGWVRFQTDWAGTQKATAAFDMEARVRLRDLGLEGSEVQYGGFLKKYGETTAAPEARRLQGAAALRDARSLDDAKRVARNYPNAEGLEAMVRQHFDGFVSVTVDGEDITAKMDPEVRIAGALMKAEWAIRRENGVQPYDAAALGALDEAQVPRATSTRLARSEEGKTKYPPCSVGSGEVGVQVSYGSLSAFVPVERSCGGSDPVFVSLRDGSLVGLTLKPGVDYRFATKGDSVVHWLDAGSKATIPLLGTPDERVLMVGPVLGQPVGTLWMLHPIAGGLPWYVTSGPPDSALQIPTNVVSAPVPDDIEMTATSDGDTLIEKGDDPSWARRLPAGAVRMWSPLFAEISGLNDGHAAFRRVQAHALPANFTVSGGDDPVPLTDTRRLELEQELGSFNVQMTRAWQTQLGPDPKLEIVFDGYSGGRPVRGLIDPKEGSDKIRLFVFEAQGARNTDVVLFRHQGRTWFGWKHRDGLEALHFDGRGLIRSWTPGSESQ